MRTDASWLPVHPWRDRRNFVGFLASLTLAAADEIAQLDGPVQTSTLAGPSGIISRFTVIATVLARAAIAPDEATKERDISIAHDETVSLSDFVGGVWNDGSKLMDAAGRCAHCLMFLIKDVPTPTTTTRSAARKQATAIHFPTETIGIPQLSFEAIDRPWRHRDVHPNDDLTKAFEAAIDARQFAFACSLFDDLDVSLTQTSVEKSTANACEK